MKCHWNGCILENYGHLTRQLSFNPAKYNKFPFKIPFFSILLIVLVHYIQLNARHEAQQFGQTKETYNGETDD